MLQCPLLTEAVWNSKSIYSKLLNVALPNHALADFQKAVLQKTKDYAAVLNIDVKIYITNRDEQNTRIEI